VPAHALCGGRTPPVDPAQRRKIAHQRAMFNKLMSDAET
jgi:hypothetical protein